MRTEEVVVVSPRTEVLVSLLGVGPVFCVGPLTQGGLDEAFGLAVGLRRVGSGAVVFDSELKASLTKVV